jgi:hypothetical protein
MNYELPEIVKGEDDIGFWKEYENSRFMEKIAGYYIKKESFFMFNDTPKFIELFFVGRRQVIV